MAAIEPLPGASAVEYAAPQALLYRRRARVTLRGRRCSRMEVVVLAHRAQGNMVAAARRLRPLGWLAQVLYGCHKPKPVLSSQLA